MKEFLLIIRGGQDESGERSPEEVQNHLEHWQQWMSGLLQQEKLIGGQPLQKEGKTLFDHGKKIIDRPLTEGEELVGGYLLIKADSLEQASNISTRCPSFKYGCSIEVREIAPIG